MVNLVDETLLMHGGRERSVAATKTFTGQMMLFYMLAAELAPEPARLVLSKQFPTLPRGLSNNSRRFLSSSSATSSWRTALWSVAAWLMRMRMSWR